MRPLLLGSFERPREKYADLDVIESSLLNVVYTPSTIFSLLLGLGTLVKLGEISIPRKLLMT